MNKLFKNAMLAFLALSIIGFFACNGNGAGVQKKEFVVRFSANGAEGELTATNGKKPIKSGDKVLEGETIEFSASIKNPNEFEVYEWTGEVVVDEKDNTKAKKEVKAEVNVSVSFKRKKSSDEVLLNFNGGAHGTLKAFVKGDEKNAGDRIPKGSVVDFVATPEDGYEVNEWSLGVTVNATDNKKASITANSEVNVTVSFKSMTPTIKEVEITKVTIGGKEWDKSSKTITLPKDAGSVAKDKVKVFGRAEGTTDGVEELTVETISPEPIVPTEDGVEVTITTKATTKLKAKTIKFTVKKLGEAKDVVLTKITVKGKEANMLSNVVVFDPDQNNGLTLTKSDIQVEGRAFGEANSTPLEVESIDPVSVEAKPLGTIFKIKTKATDKYNETSHRLTVALYKNEIVLKNIRLEYGYTQMFTSEVKDGVLVITVPASEKNREFTSSNVKVEFESISSTSVGDIMPAKIKPSNEGFGAKCIAEVKANGIDLRIPFYIRHR